MTLIRNQARVIVGENACNSDSYLKRNRSMVDQADDLVAIFGEKHSARSGTQMTVNYARKKKLPTGQGWRMDNLY